tara:strand:+ start:14591 stop:15550 length:960 start_codon:yes stop_codon:yes gene_type:complete
MKILVTTYPYNSDNFEVSVLLNKIRAAHGATIKFNNKFRKYSEEELLCVLEKEEPHIIIAGTEKYDVAQLDLCRHLKMISRVGIGLDSVNLEECRKRGIIVTHTPDAPTNAVAELTIAQMISLLRRAWTVDSEMRSGNWSRFVGREITNCSVGIIGVGRIGSAVIRKLESLRPKKILYTDTDSSREIFSSHTWSTKDRILEECDIISLHIPLNKDNIDYIGPEELSILKKDTCIINTSRGGVINEEALYMWLLENSNSSAAIDVFEKEPYTGKLLSLPNILLSPHLGSCSRTSRLEMELGAALSVDKYLRSETLLNRVV